MSGLDKRPRWVKGGTAWRWLCGCPHGGGQDFHEHPMSIMEPVTCAACGETAAPPPFPVRDRCTCIPEMRGILKNHGGDLRTVFQPIPRSERCIIATIGPRELVAAFCPFCGVSYEARDPRMAPMHAAPPVIVGAKGGGS